MIAPPSRNSSASSLLQAGSDQQSDPLPVVAHVTPPKEGTQEDANATVESRKLETDMATSRLPPRRRRKPVHSFSAGTYSLEEEKLIQQAIENSKMTQLTHGGRDLHIPHGPTFYPTVEEFEGNPLRYISKIKPIAEKYGVCKVSKEPIIANCFFCGLFYSF